MACCRPSQAGMSSVFLSQANYDRNTQTKKDRQAIGQAARQRTDRQAHLLVILSLSISRPRPSPPISQTQTPVNPCSSLFFLSFVFFFYYFLGVCSSFSFFLRNPRSSLQSLSSLSSFPSFAIPRFPIPTFLAWDLILVSPGLAGSAGPDNH